MYNLCPDLSTGMGCARERFVHKTSLEFLPQLTTAPALVRTEARPWRVIDANSRGLMPAKAGALIRLVMGCPSTECQG